MSSQSPENGIPAGSGDQSIFSCSICTKIFTKRLSRNRHVLYCRQRQLKQNPSRKKSCTLCRRAKTRCSEAIPQCTRCKAKGLDCKYDHENSALLFLELGEGESDHDVGLNLPAPRTEPATLPTQALQIPLLNPTNGENSQVDFRLNSLASHQDYLPGQLLDHEIDFNLDLEVPQYEDWLDPNRIGEIAQDVCESAHQLTVLSNSGGSRQITGHNDNQSSLQYPQELLQHPSYLNTVDGEMSLLSARAARIEPIFSAARKIGLFRRRERSFGSQLSAHFLLQTLRSYPKILLSGSLPPFIHENFGGLGNRDLVASSMELPISILPEPLAICKSIICMYFSKTSESTSFVWRTIDMELNRLGLEFHAFSEWTLMSSLQALTIYILLATLEEDNLSPAIDAKLLQMMMAVATRIEDPNYAYGIAEHGGWQEWILQESRDRTFTLLYIINMLFDINPTHDPNVCNAILSMPVPAHKSLWEAKGYPEWKKAHTGFLQKRQGRPSLAYRDMVEFHQKNQTSQKLTLGDMDDWFLNLDAFGTFVLMTASSM